MRFEELQCTVPAARDDFQVDALGLLRCNCLVVGIQGKAFPPTVDLDFGVVLEGLPFGLVTSVVCGSENTGLPVSDIRLGESALPTFSLGHSLDTFHVHDSQFASSCVNPKTF